jgi:hypothetical protein
MKSSDCCASAMKVPGMDSSQMAAMNGRAAVTADHSVRVTAAQCAPAPDWAIPEFIVRSEGTFDGSPLLTRDFHPALAWNWCADLFSANTPLLLLVEETPPRLLLSDPLSLVLRI